MCISMVTSFVRNVYFSFLFVSSIPPYSDQNANNAGKKHRQQCDTDSLDRTQPGLDRTQSGVDLLDNALQSAYTFTISTFIHSSLLLYSADNLTNVFLDDSFILAT